MINLLNIDSDLTPFFIFLSLVVLINWIYSFIMTILWFRGYKSNFPISYSIQRITFIRFYFGKSTPEVKKYFLLWNYLGTVYIFSLLILLLLNVN